MNKLFDRPRGQHEGTKTLRGIFLSTLCLFLAMCLAFITTADAAISRSPTLTPLWDKLDAARLAYRDVRDRNAISSCGGARRGTGGLRSYTQMLQDFDKSIVAYGQSPHQVFRELALDPTLGFQRYLSNKDLAAEASAGIQEALNDLMTGQSLVGNDLMIRGLRTRFPGTGDPQDPDQLTLLRQSVAAFDSGVNDVIEQLRVHPDALRASGNVIQQFPIFVENAPRPGVAQGETVENEFYRFTEIAYRDALAGNAVGRRQFFFGNVTPAGRDEAARSLKRAAQVTYLNTALLTAAQSTDDFQRNAGYQMKRQVLEASRIFDDIRAGFNPLKLLGDFVPRQPVENFLQTFDLLVASAQTDEAGYQTNLRQYDSDQTQLSTELRNQRERYLDEMSTLTGIAGDTIHGQFNDLKRLDDRNSFIAAAEAALEDSGSTGQLHSSQLAVYRSVAGARAAKSEIDSIVESMRIEEGRQQGVAVLRTRTGLQLGLINGALEYANACTVSYPAGLSCNVGVISGVSPFLNALKAYVTTKSEIDIEGINSTALIKNLALKLGTAQISLDQAGLGIEAAQADLNQLRARLQRAARNYVDARSDLECAYFTNPAYRLELDLAKENADASFEAAMIQGYFASKALEYEWAERFQNPVERIGTGNPEPIGDTTTYAPFLRAESAFAVRSAGAAGAPRPSLNQFREALRLWDQKMRQLRGNELQPEFTEIVSLRKQILGYAGGDEEVNRLLFANYIAKNRKPGRDVKDDVYIPFSLTIADQRIFPAEPNLKVVKIGMNIKSRPPHFAADSAWSGGAFRAELVMLDEAQLRTFFADFGKNPPDDDLIHIDLEEGRSLSISPFRGLLQATVDGTPTGTPENVQLANLSPAVSRWVMHFDMSNGQNTNLIPEYIDDIELRITYKFGRPRTITF